MSFFSLPPCTASRSRVMITSGEYDRLRIACEELETLKRGRPKTTIEWLRETFDPPIPLPVYNRPAQEPYKHRGQVLREMCEAYHRGHQVEPPPPGGDGLTPAWLRDLGDLAGVDPLAVDPWESAVSLAFDRVEGKDHV